MTIRQLGQDDGAGDDFHPAELARALARIEATLAGLENRLVVRAVYEAEQREAHNVVTQLSLRCAEDRERFTRALDQDREHARQGLIQERAATQAWQAGFVSWFRWIAGLAVTAFLGVAALAITLLTSKG